MRKKKRVAILADFPWSFFSEGETGRGGGQQATWLSQVALEFGQSRDFEFHWVTLDRELFFGRTRRMEWLGQWFHNIPVWRRKPDIALGYSPSRLLLARELRRIRPDLVHAWGTESPYPVVFPEVRVPKVLSMQGVLTYLDSKNHLPNTWMWRRMAAMERGMLQSATLVTCESRWAMDRVLEIVPGMETRQVEYGVNPRFYGIRSEPDYLKPYAYFAGTLAAYKGVDVLLDAVRMVKNRGWELKIAGDGPLRDAVVSCGIPGVEWLGVLRWPDLQEVMRKAVCLVHPTLADSSPNVVKEARVVGIPVITTPHGGQAGYIHDGENGMIVDPLNAGNLAAALERMLGDPDLARRLGGTRHAADREYFLPRKTAEGFFKIYHELLRR